jgi:hypothetical protein
LHDFFLTATQVVAKVLWKLLKRVFKILRVAPGNNSLPLLAVQDENAVRRSPCDGRGNGLRLSSS